MPTPRVAAIHDLSGFGRCSLTVAIPILSAMGVQCCPLPTAFLSTHTGGFTGYTFLDMTDEMPRVAEHWKSLDLRFDAIYSGFLGSERQIDIVADFVRTFRQEGTVVVVDPVMGDDGRAYQTYTPAMCAGMSRLAELADVITPNLTEAAFLLNRDYWQLPGAGREPVAEAELRALAEELSLDGRRSVVLTGMAVAPGKTGAVCFDAKTGQTDLVQTDFVAHPLHGTGDVFASVLTGALVKGTGLREAAAQAAEFVRCCAVRTVEQDLPLGEGVDFEPLLGLLTGEGKQV
jgi:pyridoxine kinase